MKKNSTPFFYLFLIAILAISSCGQKKTPTNFILFMADDFGWGDAGFNGNTSIQTPNMDHLAASGIIFDRFYSASPVCSPTRASCLTGRNPYRMGIPTANQGHMLQSETTLAELLKEQGYTTGHFGKWHLGTFTTEMKDANRGKKGDSTHLSIPSQHGFDEFFSSESKVPTWDPLRKPLKFDLENGESLRYGWAARKQEDSQEYGTHYWTDKNTLATGNFDGDDTRIIVDQAIDFIQRAKESKQAFFAVVWTHTPHLPVVVNEEYQQKYPNDDLVHQLYNGCITALDDQLGRLWSYLEENELANSTCLFFSSDNGPEVRTPGSAGPFRGRKRDLYEGGIRVPAFCIWPEEIAENQKTNYPAFSSDYLPTIAQLAGITLPNELVLDGASLVPVFANLEMVRKAPMGFLFGQRMSWVTHQHKLISVDRGNSFELYDLLIDPSETKNIILENPILAEQLKRELGLWLSTLANPELPNFTIPQIPNDERI